MKNGILLLLICVLISVQCLLAQKISLQTNILLGKYYLQPEPYGDDYSNDSYSKGKSLGVETNLVVERIGWSRLGLQLGFCVNKSYNFETFKYVMTMKPLLIYRLCELNNRLNFLSFSISPQIKLLKKHDLYVFVGYHKAFLMNFHQKGKIASSYSDYPLNTENGFDFEQNLNRKELQGEEPNVYYTVDMQGLILGMKYSWKKINFQLTERYIIASLDRQKLGGDSHTMLLGIGYVLSTK